MARQVGVTKPNEQVPVLGAASPSPGPQTFDAFVAARGAALVLTARRLLGDPHDAEDVVQDVLISLHRRWDAVLAAEVPDAYVRRALVNQCTSFWRRPARREVSRDVPGLDGGADASVGVDDRLLILGLLRRLPAKQRAVLVLRHYEGLADTDIAEVMGTSVQTVRSNIHRGLAALRGLLDDREGNLR